MGLKKYTYKGKPYTAHNKEELAHRLFARRDRFGRMVVPRIDRMKALIKKAPDTPKK